MKRDLEVEEMSYTGPEGPIGAKVYQHIDESKMVSTQYDEVTQFKQIIDHMLSIFEKKRADYGPSTTETFKKFGMLSMCIRMHDKLARLENLCKNNKLPAVADETITDTLLDLANYAVIAIIELNK